MQIQVMKRIGLRVKYGVPIVCASCITARHFWKVPSRNSVEDEKNSKILKDGKKNESPNVISSILSGTMWKSYADKNPDKAPKPEPAQEPETAPTKEQGKNIVSSILSGTMWKSKASIAKESSNGDSAVGDLKDKWLGDTVGKVKVPDIRDEWLSDFEFYVSKIPNQILDNRMKESLQDLARLGDNVYRKVDKTPDHPMFLNIALLRLFAIQTHEDSAFISNSDDRGELADLSDEFAAEIVHFFKYADEVYEADPTVLRQDIVLNQLEENEALHIPRHIVFLDHITKSIVVAIRGTASLNDMITDLYIEAAPFLESSREIYAHKGIAESAQAMLPSITTTINKIKNQDRGKYEKYRVVTTGHSLGAGSAALLAILLSSESKIPVECFAFAPPPIISNPDVHKPRFPFEFMNSSAPCVIHSFVHDRDFITRCSHKELLNMLSALTAIDGLKWSDYERSSAVFRGKLTDSEKMDIRDALHHHRSQIVDGNDVALYVPGDIMLIRPVVSAEVTTAEHLPEEQPASEQSSAYSLNGAWQRVKQTVNERGSGVVSSNVTETKPPVSSAGEASAAQARAKNSEEKESERQKEKLRLDRLQYEVIAVPSADALFNGLLYYGDSMVNDHLITSYRRALLRMIKS